MVVQKLIPGKQVKSVHDASAMLIRQAEMKIVSHKGAVQRDYMCINRGILMLVNLCISYVIVLSGFQLQFGVIHRSEEHTSELQSLMRISYAVFCLKKKNIQLITNNTKH